MAKGRLLTMPAFPGTSHLQRDRRGDMRYVQGQRVLVSAIRYLVQTDPRGNLAAVELLSEHFRTRFRMSDKPQVLQPQG